MRHIAWASGGGSANLIRREQVVGESNANAAVPDTPDIKAANTLPFGANDAARIERPDGTVHLERSENFCEAAGDSDIEDTKSDVGVIRYTCKDLVATTQSNVAAIDTPWMVSKSHWLPSSSSSCGASGTVNTTGTEVAPLVSSLRGVGGGESEKTRREGREGLSVASNEASSYWKGVGGANDDVIARKVRPLKKSSQADKGPWRGTCWCALLDVCW